MKRRFSNLKLPTALFAMMLAPFAAAAQDGPIGFRSPSNNIHCQFEPSEKGRDDDAGLRCDLMSTVNRPPPRPRDCELEYGQAFEIVGNALRGEYLCYGDTVKDDSMPVLQYGQNWQRQGLTCRSEETGVMCFNSKGHGFELSRGAQRVF